MNKPVSLVIEDAKLQIEKTIVNLHLSPSLLKYVVRDIYEELQRASVEELRNDRATYKEEE